MTKQEFIQAHDLEEPLMQTIKIAQEVYGGQINPRVTLRVWSYETDLTVALRGAVREKDTEFILRFVDEVPEEARNYITTFPC